MFIFSAISTTGFSVIWLVQEYDQFKEASEKLREEYVEGQKHLTRSEVIKALSLVEYRVNQIETRLKQTIKKRGSDAHELATNLYRQFRNSKSEDELKHIITESLRVIRYNGGRGYNFIIDQEGVIQMLADRPELEGRNLATMRSVNDKKVFRDISSIGAGTGEGFYDYLWTKPAAGEDKHRKISYIKFFKPFNWIIGTGDYLDDVVAEIQDEALEILVTYRFGTNGYLFGSTYRGEPLFTNGRITKGTSSIWNLTDPNGVRIIQTQREAVRNPEGGYYTYSWRKLDSPVLSPKLSFSKGIPEWEWMIGAGVYMDEIEGTIDDLRGELRYKIRNQFIKIAIVFLVLVLISYLAAKYFSVRTRRSIEGFLSFFKKASTDYVQIDPSNMLFSEFVDLADLINKVVRDREESQQALTISETRWRSLTENSPDQILTLDRDMKIQFTNYAVPGLTVEEMIGSPFYQYVKGTDKQAEVKVIMETVLQTGERQTYEDEYTNPDGETVYYESQVVPKMLVNSGDIIGLTISSRDITDRKRAEQQIKASLGEKETLLQEIHHRVKNNLAVVSGLLSLQVNSIQDEQLREALRDSQSRVQSMSTLHEILYQSDNLSAIQLKTYITKLATEASRNFTVGHHINLEITSEDIEIDVGQASPLGLVVNELITNSFKYAFPDNQEGGITIQVSRTESDEVKLVFADNGVGIPGELDMQHIGTMGLNLVKILVEGQLHGSLELKRDAGTCFIITFNLNTKTKRTRP